MVADAKLATGPVRIGELLAQSVLRFGTRPALEADGRSWTYAELAAQVQATESALRRLGARAGDRVVIAGANSVQEVSLLFAASNVGAWPALVSGRVAPAQLDAIVAQCDPSLVLYVANGPEAAAHAGRRRAEPLPFTALAGVHVEHRDALPEFAAARPEDEIAAMICTSGTTSAPKIAMLSHGNLVFIALTQRRLRRYDETDKTYCALPLAHVGALGILMCVIAAGACMHLERRFAPAALAHAIREHGISVVPGLPPLHVKFLEWVAEHPHEFTRGRVRLVTTSSSPLHAPVKRAVEDLYGCPLQNAYGLTEATGVVFQTEAGRRRNDTSVGRPIPGIAVRIAVDHRTAAKRERGEIQVRGPNVFRGYFRNEAATAAAFTPDGWLRSGDLGYVDAGGVGFITGRDTETIKRSGYSIQPAAVEAALNEHPAVALAAVVRAERVPDQEVVAFIELKPQARVERQELLAFSSERLATYELPGELRFVAQLPTLMNGKVDRALLRVWAAQLPPAAH